MKVIRMKIWRDKILNNMESKESETLRNMALENEMETEDDEFKLEDAAETLEGDILKDVDESEFELKVNENLGTEELDNLNANEISYLRRYLVEIGSIPLLTREEEKKYGLLAKNGDSYAREIMINSNLKLVVKIAKKYKNVSGISFEDLIQEGNIGLMKAVDKFDATKENKFSTYAVWWIRQSMWRAICQSSRNIRLPVHIHEMMFTVKKAAKMFYEENFREPTIDELADYSNLPPAKIEMILNNSKGTDSLDRIIVTDNSDDTTLIDMIKDETAETPEEKTMKKILKEEFDEILFDLNEKERNIIIMRFGLNGCRTFTLQEVGGVYGISRERVRQIENKVLAKLKIKCSKKGLNSFLK